MVIPVHDDNPTRRPAVVTWTLILLNVVVFLVEPITLLSASGDGPQVQQCRQLEFFHRWAAIPKELVTNEPLPLQPKLVPGEGCLAVPSDGHKQPALSVLSAMFLHGGLLHLAGNMLFLYVFGNNVEDRLGRLRYLLFYLGCGYVATYAFAFANPGSQTTLVGASGAIAGVLGAYLVFFPRTRVVSLMPFLLFLPVRLPAWLVIVPWFLLQWIYASGTAVGSGGGVAYLAHVAGFVAGLGYALVANHRRAALV